MLHNLVELLLLFSYFLFLTFVYFALFAVITGEFIERKVQALRRFR